MFKCQLLQGRTFWTSTFTRTKFSLSNSQFPDAYFPRVLIKYQLIQSVLQSKCFNTILQEIQYLQEEQYPISCNSIFQYLSSLNAFNIGVYFCKHWHFLEMLIKFPIFFSFLVEMSFGVKSVSHDERGGILMFILANTGF